MKIYRKITFLLLSCLFAISSLNAQTEFTQGIGIALKTSTNGIGGDVVYHFHKRLCLRLGYEQLRLNHNFTFEEESVEYAADANYKTGSLSLLLDYYVIRHVFFTGGAGLNLFHTVFDGKAVSPYQFGDIQISPEKIGTFNFQIDPSAKISPYLGIGFGRTLGLKKKVGFAFEIGGFYQGPPKLTIASTGLLSPTSNPDQQHAQRLEKQINQYTVYPVLKFSLSYRIADL
jgi:hypothetical protein